jgi:sugar phosphate isomerase/epimerase
MDFSFQLYSARNGGPLDETLGKLKALGYAQVEGWGGLYTDPPAIAASLKKHGLTMPTGHFGLNDLQDTGKAMKIAETIGVRTLFCPAIPQDQRTADEADWKRLADTLAGLGETYKKAGYGFGWHNHDFEFKPTSAGTLPMNIILDHAPDLEWEIDVAWLVKGNNTPADWFSNYGDRITAIHVKDIAPAGQALDEDGWADVGQGTLDWQALFSAIQEKTKAKYFVMEHDKPNDIDRFARRSIESVKKWK